MKGKGLIIAAIIFFLTVNTNYFWEGKLGLIGFPVFMFLALVYLALVFGLIAQMFSAINEKFSNRQRLYGIALLTVVLGLIFFFPNGLVNFDRLEGKDLLIAKRQGAANCMTTLKLKERNKFIERSVCFGVSEIKGNYELKNDTIFFTNVTFGRDENEYYKFAVIKRADNKNEKAPGNLVRYKSSADTIGHVLWIKENELKYDSN